MVKRDDCLKCPTKLLTSSRVFVVQTRGIHSPALCDVADGQPLAEPQGKQFHAPYSRRTGFRGRFLRCAGCLTK